MGGVDICAIASRIDLTFNNLTSVNFVYTYISIRYISNQYSLISYSFSKIVFCPKNRSQQATLFSFPIHVFSPQ